ncbi:hypothetical protein [Allostreptomyces psammosilenae]|uniref:Uncharacterized protein n=1 Tax=Allostreptomyces psammosilenae TaxID=1892865 RepID=A0A852ZZY8_9ACTN|nr:hypothetical protein [Allostreptomyces psammosilenae]NYI07685.1 hypothetical protein [Allostreptomyces psammosilenae]
MHGVTGEAGGSGGKGSGESRTDFPPPELLFTHAQRARVACIYCRRQGAPMGEPFWKLDGFGNSWKVRACLDCDHRREAEPRR